MSEYRLGRYRNGYCAVRYIEGKRQRNSLGEVGRIEAVAIIDRLNADLRKAPGQTIRDLWAAYIEENSHKKIVIRMAYSFKALEGHFADKVPAAVGVALSRDYVRSRRGMGRQDGTIWTELNHLRVVLSWATKNDRIAKAPLIELPPKPEPKDRWLTRDEIAALLASATTPHIKLFILLAIATGGRLQALLELTWSRVDFEENTIQLSTGERGLKGRATVPMNATIRPALLDAKKGAQTDHVIEWAGKPVKQVKRALAATAKRAGIEGVTAHVFRHSAAVWQAEHGIPMPKIAQFLGHKDSRITERVYARFAPGHMQDAADVLNLGLHVAGSNEPDARRTNEISAGRNIK